MPLQCCCFRLVGRACQHWGKHAFSRIAGALACAIRESESSLMEQSALQCCWALLGSCVGFLIFFLAHSLHFIHMGPFPLSDSRVPLLGSRARCVLGFLLRCDRGITLSSPFPAAHIFMNENPENEGGVGGEEGWCWWMLSHHQHPATG